MRRWLPWLCLGVVLAATAPAAAQGSGAALDRPRSGADAVRALGDRLPAVAAAHQTSAGVLRERLETDPSLWVDTQGRLFYVDPAAPDHVEAGEPTSTTQPLPAETDAFGLHSRPGAPRTIYLDFDGHDALGGAWSAGYTGGDGVAEPYDTDKAPATFSPTELAEIRSIWQRVAEDFAPFHIDVTTAAPDAGAIDRSSAEDQTYGTRVVLTSTVTDCGCGGVAYVGVFDHFGASQGHAYYQPALVYAKGAKAAAEAASHEAGHNLGLSHDGTRKTGYYPGHGDWAPIMGVGYYEPISQWSRGEYSGANNREDDVAVAGSNGAPLRADDHGTATDATPVALPEAGSATASGVITTASDVDELALQVAAPATLTIEVDPALVSPNLDVRAVLRGPSGAEVASSNPLSSAVTDDVAAGLDASITAQVGAGTYVLSLDGVGARDPLSSGYSDYGSLGSYTVSMTTSAPDSTVVTVTPPAAPTSVSAAASGSSVVVQWTAGSTNQTGFEVRREKYQRGTWSTAHLQSVSDTTRRYDDSPGAGTFRYAVRSVNSAGASAWAAAAGKITIAKTTSAKGSK